MPPPKGPSLGNSEYQVGWICALPIEMTAARAMLDEIHESPQEQDPRDQNNYCLGRIQKHNVVIACLPDYGTTSAAVVAVQMLHTFKKIRFGLMVGIGGGVPSAKNDIRLGDIVVSRPGGTLSGVVQYDLVKKLKDGRLQRTGSLDRPPQLLLTALRTLESDYDMEDTKIPTFLDEMAVNYAKMQTKYMSSGPEKDRLFKEEYDHPDTSESCDDCDLSQLIDRRPRQSNTPIIHYGLIASGNQVTKHALTRSRLGKDLGVLCFEMEAAGLMNHFKCLVIRGICDYCDSHKNDEWQPYAAITAAAYAKELLLVIPVHKVQMEEPIVQVADLGLHRIAEQSRAADHEHYRKVDMRYRDDRDRKCHQVFRTSEYESAKDQNPDAVEGTCQWVLNHSHYQSWLESTHHNLLWISADPGCGKSVLLKALVDREFKSLESHSTCYFFFKDDGLQNGLSTALCALLHQLFSHHPHLLHHATPSCDKNGEKLQKEVGELWQILLSAATDVAANNVICILDALDECASDGQRTLIKFLTDFYDSSVEKLARNSTLKFLVTSRPYYDIERRFQTVTSSFPTIRLAGEKANKEISAEIDHVIGAWIVQLSAELNLLPHLQELLQIRLQQIQNRTYLWLYLVFEEIRKSPRRTEKWFRKIIDEIPKSVDEAYEKILNKSSHREEARIFLSIILVATRPLTLKEMDVALALANQGNVSSYKDLQLEGDILQTVIRDLCGMFVYTVDSRIHLLHQTAKEFLLKGGQTSGKISNVWKQSLDEQYCETNMAMTCIRYLLLSNFERTSLGAGRKRKGSSYEDEEKIRHPESEESDDSDDSDNFHYSYGSGDGDGRHTKPLYDLMDYAAKYWPAHFRNADLIQESEEFRLSLSLFNTDTPRFNVWFPIWFNRKYHPSSKIGWTGLHFAAYCGHGNVVSYLLNHKNIKVDTKDKKGATALIGAASQGHNSVVRLLVDWGADVNVYTEDGGLGTPLQAAAYKGNKALVRFLIDSGADVNMSGGYYSSALQAAALNGHEMIVEVLLKNGADVNISGGFHGSALQAAALKGHEMIVEVLLRHGANDLDGALSAAAQNGKVAMVQLLIGKGAGNYNKALLAAAGFGSEVIARLLIEKGANNHNEALLAAANSRGEAVMSLLMKEGADDYTGALGKAFGWYRTGLCSVIHGLESIEDEETSTILGRYAAIMQLLIAKGADTYIVGDDYVEVVWAGASGAHRAALRLLKGKRPGRYDGQ